MFKIISIMKRRKKENNSFFTTYAKFGKYNHNFNYSILLILIIY